MSTKTKRKRHVSTSYEIEHKTIIGWSLFMSAGPGIIKAKESLKYWSGMSASKLRLVRVTSKREVVK